MNISPKTLSATLFATLSASVCLGLCNQAAAFTDSELQQKMQQLVAQKAKTDQPGFSVIVRKGPHLLLRGGYGLADLETATPMRADSNLRLASQTKQFTAMAVFAAGAGR